MDLYLVNKIGSFAQTTIRLLMLLINQCVLYFRELITYSGMNRDPPHMTQVGCFIIIVWSSIVLLSTFSVFSLIHFYFLTMYNDVWITFLVVNVLFCYILMTWNMYVCVCICPLWWNKRFTIIIITSTDDTRAAITRVANTHTSTARVFSARTVERLEMVSFRFPRNIVLFFPTKSVYLY